MKIILLTGFEAFGNEVINPSWEAVKLLDKCCFDGNYKVISEQLSCTFEDADIELEQLIIKHNPYIVLNVGQAAGRNSISIEKVAINWIDARIADNRGYKPSDVSILADQPTAYFSNLPLKSIVSALSASGIPCSISYSAGTFVCNYVFYSLMHLIHNKYNHIRGGFIHTPLLPEQIVKSFEKHPSMELDVIVMGLKLIIQEIVSPKNYTNHIDTGTIC